MYPSKSPSLNRSLNESLNQSMNNSMISLDGCISNVEKCNACQIHFYKKDLEKHSRRDSDLKVPNLCKSYIESYFKLCDNKSFNDGTSTIQKEKSHLFDYCFLLSSSNLLYTSSIQFFSKEKLKDISLSDGNVILISPELMQHRNLNVGDLVSVYDLNENNYKGYFVIQCCPLVKNCLSVGFNKETFQKKSISSKQNILRIQLKITCKVLKSLYVEIQREFIDPIIYLNVCCSIKKFLLKKVRHFDSNDSVISVIINDIEYELAIHKTVVLNLTNNSLESNFSNLSITGKNDAENSDQTMNLAFLINKHTRIIFPPLKIYEQHFKFVGYEEQCKLLRSLILKPVDKDMVLNLPKTILLTGPTGTGKTLAMRSLINDLQGQMNISIIPSALLLSKSFEFDKLSQVFKNLIKLKPSLLFMDNLEDISNEKNQLEKRLVSWLKVFFDDLPKQEHIIIVGATNRADLLDTSLRRPGRFDYEIDFPVPTPADRKIIFKEILEHFTHNLQDIQISLLSDAAHGFTGADLESICRNYLIDQADAVLEYETIADMIARTKPSTMREITLELPNVRWSDIGGLLKLKELLEECVVWPIKQPDSFIRLGIDPPKGILMYGPPGCCKTMIGKALANESGLNFFSIKGPELFNKWVGESERAIREIFRKARAASPSILFFDEIDALATERGQTQSAVGDRVLAQLLTEIDGIEKLSKVIIIAATNRPDIVDKALLRPGRLDSIVYVPLPDLETRKEIFKIRLLKMPIQKETMNKFEEFIENLATLSDGYSGAEINAICQRAALLSLKNDRDAKSIQEVHFIHALDMVRPQTSRETIEFYEKFASKFNVMI